MKIYLIRHTSVNSDPRVCYGWNDVDVSKNFQNEAERVKKYLDGKELKYFSSDLLRCKKLTEFLTEEYSIDSGLREINFGDWEGKYWNDIEKTFDDFNPDDFVNKKTPNGESYKDQQKRVLTSWNKIINSGSENIVIVSHGGSIRIILCELLNMDLANAFRLKIDYGSISEVSINDKFITIDKFNF